MRSIAARWIDPAIASSAGYMLLAGPLLGRVLASLYLWGDGIVAPFATHLALNVVEFGRAVRLRPRSGNWRIRKISDDKPS